MNKEEFDEDFIRLFSKSSSIPASRISGMLKRRVLQKVSRYFIDYYRFEKSTSGVEAGTAVFKLDGGIDIIRGFPKIQRAMVLDAAIKAHFNGLQTVAVEEKMNGYNVRIALIKDRMVALTRGGLVCPYTTEKVNEMIGREFFQDHPELMLCGEMVGPDNPYVPKDIYPDVESISFYIFDIREKKTGRPLTISRKYEVCSRYNIRTIRYFGKYHIDTAAAKVTDIIRELGSTGREGVVIKDPEMIVPPIKYTCSQSTNSDLKYAFRFFNDYGRDFFFSRVVREGFQSVDWDEAEKDMLDRCRRLGESILIPMIETIRKRKQGERISEEVRIRVSSLETARAFEDHLRYMGIDFQCDEPQYIEGKYLIVIRKFNQSTNDRTEGLLNGHLW